MKRIAVAIPKNRILKNAKLSKKWYFEKVKRTTRLSCRGLQTGIGELKHFGF